MSESYELKLINVPKFSNLERGGTSESKLEKDDDYDYDHDLAILKAIYHYYFNHGALANKIVILEHHFFKVMKMAARVGYYPEIIHPICRKIFNFSMALWG
ncbi:hypothetical protein P3L10_022017 [Capsicum annuum]